MRQITLAEFEALQQRYAEAEAGESPPQVEEHLSGMVQQLAATPNAVAYKNFTGDHIEETTLLIPIQRSNETYCLLRHVLAALRNSHQ